MLTEVLNIFQARLAEAKLPVYVHNESVFSSEVHSDCLCQNQRGGQTHLEWGSGLLLLPRPTPSIGDNKITSPEIQTQVLPHSGSLRSDNSHSFLTRIPNASISTGGLPGAQPAGAQSWRGCLCETPERAPTLPMGWGLGCGLFL